MIGVLVEVYGESLWEIVVVGRVHQITSTCGRGFPGMAICVLYGLLGRLGIEVVKYE